MSRIRHALVLSACLFFALGPEGRGDELLRFGVGFAEIHSNSRKDLHGDVMPSGARTRMGTMRFRHGSAVNAVSFSSDGKLLASGSSDQTVRLWDVGSGKEIMCLKGYPSVVRTIALSPKGNLLALSGDDLSIRLWDIAANNEINLLKQDDKVRTIIFSPDGKLLAAAGETGIFLWDISSGKKLREWSAQRNAVRTIAFSPDGKFLASGGADDTLHLWELPSCKETRQWRGNHDAVVAIAFSTSTKDPVIARALVKDEGKLCVWDPAAGKVLPPFLDHPVAVLPVALSPDGKTFALGGKDRKIRIGDIAAGRERHRLAGHEGEVLAVAFSSDGKMLASGSSDGTVRLWDPVTGKDLHPWEAHAGAITALAYSPDGKTLASASTDRTIRIWQTIDGKSMRTLTGHDGVVLSVAFAPDGKTLASAGADSSLRLWDLAAGKEMFCQKDYREGVNAVAFSPDGKILASGSDDATVRLLDPATGKETRRLEGHKRAVTALAFAPDGATLASGSTDQTVCLWDLATGKERASFEEEDYVFFVAFSSDGRHLASGNRNGITRNGIFRLREVKTGKEVFQLKEIVSARLSPDSRTIARSSTNKVLHLCETATGQTIEPYFGNGSWITSIAFSPDGQTLASGSTDTTVLIWDLTLQWDLTDTDQELPPGKIAKSDLEKYWADLADANASKAYRALWLLTSAPEQTVPWLRARLKPAPLLQPQRLAQLIADLDHDQFTVREKASRDLAELKELAEPALRRTLANDPPLEVRRRIEQLLEKLDKRAPPTDWLRAVRAVAVLEYIGNAEARKILEDLSKGEPEARQTQDAKAALGRLERSNNSTSKNAPR